VIRVGIVGSNYGRTVLLPAFRADDRCAVVAIAGTDAARTRALADESGVATSHGGWRALVDDSGVDAVAIATRPDLQPEIALRAIAAGKAVFAEKPMASDLEGARRMLEAIQRQRIVAAIDFNFHQIASWQRAKQMLDGGAIGALRHVAVHWHIENRSTQLRMRNWKTVSGDGGGVLGNFISHCFHYLEWFCGPLAGLSARLGGLPGDDTLQTTATMALVFAGGAPGSLSMSCASYLGAGHRVEFYGDDGTLLLGNIGADYMRGFELLHARRPAATLTRIPVDDPADAQYPDGRIAPVSRLIKGFLDAIENGGAPKPGFAEGYRVQQLIDASERSHQDGRWADVRPEIMERA
jgi:predicted dehydrogenase